MENQLANLKCLVIGADGDVGFASVIALLKGGAHTVYIQGVSNGTATCTMEKLNKLAKQCEWPGTVSLFKNGGLFDKPTDDPEQMREISVLIVNTSVPMSFCDYTSKITSRSFLDLKIDEFARSVDMLLKGHQRRPEDHYHLNVIFLGSSQAINWYNKTSEHPAFIYNSKDQVHNVSRRGAIGPKLSVNIIKHGFMTSDNGLVGFEGLTRNEMMQFSTGTFFSSAELETVIHFLASKTGRSIGGSSIFLGRCAGNKSN